MSRTGGPEHHLVYGRPKQILNLVGKTDHNVVGLWLHFETQIILFYYKRVWRQLGVFRFECFLLLLESC